MADDRISLREILAMLGRRFVWVLLPFLLFTGLAVAAGYYMMPVYEASTTLIITNPTGSPTSYETLLFNRNLAKTYSEVARSRSVAAEAAAMLGLQESLDQFQERIRVSVVRDTEVIEIAVVDTDPVRAASAANALASAFRSRFWEFTFLDSLRIVDPAEPPAKPIRPQPVLYIAVGVVVGLAAGVGLAALVDHLFPRGPRPAAPEPAAPEDEGQASASGAPAEGAMISPVPMPGAPAPCGPTARAPAESGPAARAWEATAPLGSAPVNGASPASVPAGGLAEGLPVKDVQALTRLTDSASEASAFAGSAPTGDASGASAPPALHGEPAEAPPPVRRRRRYRHRFCLFLRRRRETDQASEGPTEGMGEVHA